MKRTYLLSLELEPAESKLLDVQTLVLPSAANKYNTRIMYTKNINLITIIPIRSTF